MYIAVDQSYTPKVLRSGAALLRYIERYAYIVKDKFDDVVEEGIVHSVKNNGYIYLYEDLGGEFVEKVTFVEDV
jgi:hypothetical protein